jgi:hypothetical protein
MSKPLPKPLPPVQTQITQLQNSVSALACIQNNITAGYITQGQVNAIVARVVLELRSGE